MGSKLRLSVRNSALLGVALWTFAPSTALAQSAQTDSDIGASESLNDREGQEFEIVVTGTLLRNSAPVGQSVISAGQEEIQEQGATTANELLATIPQVSNLFNNVPTSRLAVAANQIQVVRPNLRSLSPETGSSSSTLVLFDGHRIAGVGVTQSSVDPDLIPTGAIERVEVVTDGGSATYGADAVGGVINFITRKRFDGLKVDARYGFADDYWTVDANVTAGKDWGSGSIFASYMFQKNSALFGRDRDWIRRISWNADGSPGAPLGRSCVPGNVQLGGTFYPLPSLDSANGPNTCDDLDDSSSIPEAKRHGLVAGLHQELANWLTVDLRGFYGKRESTSFSPMRGTVAVTPGQFYRQTVAGDTTSNQTVFFNFAPALGLKSAPSGSGYETWGANAEFDTQLSDNWRMRTLFNYSRSFSDFFIVAPNPTLLAAAGSSPTAAGAVNFYDLTSSPNLAVIQAIANNLQNVGQGKNELLNFRNVVDGTLLSLPGGDVMVALGYEHMTTNFKQRSGTNLAIGAIDTRPFNSYTQKADSFFGEMQVPIFGEGNRSGGLYSLVLSGSVRYDKFNDFGSTWNPKVGVSYKPVDWLALRGNYSTSFNAPTPIDQLASTANFAGGFPFAAFIRPEDSGQVSFFSHTTVALQGATPDLKPQTAETWSVGFDADPPFVPGLRMSASYYNVKFTDLLDIPTPNNGIFANFPNNVQTSITGFSREEAEAFAARAPGGVAAIQGILADPRPIYLLVDFRRGNYGTLKVEGLDFNVSYRTDTGFGSIDAGVSGNYTLTRETQVAPGARIIDRLNPDPISGADGAPNLLMQAQLGATIGQFRSQLTWNHNAGYDTFRSATLPQDHVGAFNTFNLFLKYDVDSEAMMFRDLSFTVNVNNLFDEAPPVYKGLNGNGYANGFTIGRLVMFGVSKKF